jgi:hypothetical protein
VAGGARCVLTDAGDRLLVVENHQLTIRGLLSNNRIDKRARVKMTE